ncbi:JmjC domain-containing protein [Pseudaeromonas sharmana]|uniref:JmjC domain-containing protein n=1 Tax=Pseudaeromonas sharmana TaxID=328412 RepID=A0ABV8CNA6_9GAMM
MAYHVAIHWPDFLQKYWQKQPVVLRRALFPFVDPLSADELAGLAMEELIDSRLVSRQQGKWHVQHGPFESFDHLGECDWSLLVQAVDHWHPVAAGLMEPFRSLPNWRLDDLMISFSVPGGGVGPHIDQYDVFIIQGMGRRRWRVGAKGDHPQVCPHPGLLQVADFTPIIDAELEAGDILYIPPGFPHDGYALEPALNYSVGFRAPNQRELFSHFADYLLQQDGGNQRYSDPELQPSTAAGCIQNHEVQQLRDMMQALLTHDDFAHQLAQSLSEAKHELALEPVEPPFTEGEIYDRLEAGERLVRLGGLRALYLEGEELVCFINGEAFSVPDGAFALIKLLCDQTVTMPNQLDAYLSQPEVLAWLSMLINSGYWYFEADMQSEDEA